MLGTGKPVRFISSWQTYRVGDEIDPPGGLRQDLLAMGIVEEIEAPSRPAKLARAAAAKIADGTRKLFGGGESS
jgi:hypothetical protein